MPDMDSSSTIVGRWKIPSTTVEGVDEFMHVGEDGRIVHFVYIDSAGKRCVPMMLWTKLMKDDYYWVSAKPNGEAWRVRMYPTSSGMKIDRAEEAQFDLAPAMESELPDWYHERLSKALKRMDERDQEAAKA